MLRAGEIDTIGDEAYQYLQAVPGGTEEKGGLTISKLSFSLF